MRRIFYSVLVISGLAMCLNVFTAHLVQAAQTAVVITQASDYSSGDFSVISVEQDGDARIVRNQIMATNTSDVSVCSYGEYFYRIGRQDTDNVTKFHIESPNTPIWQFSAMDDDDTIPSNPYTMVFVDETKAYLIRYGADVAWIVNPSATVEDDFKIGELDLSAYDANDNIPDMSNGVIVDGKLFIVMQSQFAWTAGDAYVAVFDITTDEEIDTDPATDGLYGILLPIKNPEGMVYLEENNTIYIQGLGNWYADSGSGIASLDPDTYVTSTIVEGDDSYPTIFGLAVVSQTKGYFINYYDNSATWDMICSVLPFNPSTGEVGSVIAQLDNISIASLAVDDNAKLWVSDQTNAKVVIVDTADDTVEEEIDTELNPNTIAFVEGEPVMFNDDDDDSCFIQCVSGSSMPLWTILAACFSLVLRRKNG